MSLAVCGPTPVPMPSSALMPPPPAPSRSARASFAVDTARVVPCTALAVVPSQVASGPEPSEAATHVVLATCASGPTQELEGQLVNLRSDDPQNFARTLCNAVFPTLLRLPHQRPCGAAAALHNFVIALASVDPGAIETTLQWLLRIQGGPGCAARDTGDRWRCAALMGGFAQVLMQQQAKKSTTSDGSAGVSNPSLTSQLAADLAASFLALAQDRSSDVRLLAVDGLRYLALSTSDAQSVVAQRSMQDCDGAVRAAAVRTLIACTGTAPAEVAARARLDKETRVRRSLLEEFDTCLRRSKPGPNRLAHWANTILFALGDRSLGVRKAAVRCIHDGISADPDGWPKQLLADTKVAEHAVGPLACALARILAWQDEVSASSSAALRRQLAPRNVIIGAEDEACSDNLALFARLSVAVSKVVDDGATDAGSLEQMIMNVLGQKQQWEHEPEVFQLRQLLIATLQTELPIGTAARAGLARVAAAVLLRAPPREASEALLGHGVFPVSKLGARVDSAPTAFLLALLLLRRIVSEGAEGGQRTTEAWFSKTVAATVRSISKAFEEARRQKSACEDEAASLRERLQWQQGATEAQRRESEERVRQAEQNAIAAQTVYDEVSLRAVVIAGAWLQQSRASVARDTPQRELLDGLLKPALQDPDAEHSKQVAAVHGIALYASKNAEYAVSHWSFFVGLLENHMDQLQDLSDIGSEGRVAVRFTEIAMLFVCDSILLHKRAIGDQRVLQGFGILARVLWTLDSATGVHLGWSGWARQLGALDLCHLRASLCERACCLAMMGHLQDGGAAAQWVLGRLLGFVCGIGSPPSPHAESTVAAKGTEDLYTSLVPAASSAPAEPVPQEEEGVRASSAVMCSRILRFFAMLPCASPTHAEFLVMAAESLFASRLWMLGTPPRSGSNRATPAVRAARFVCTRLAMSSAALAAAGVSSAALQLKVIRSIGAARLVAPEAQTGMLCDALAAGVLASIRGSTVVDWAGDAEGPKVMDALTWLLGDWAPTTSAKSVEALLKQLHGRPPQEDWAWQWLQDALDSAADFRHDLARCGLSTDGGLRLAGPRQWSSSNRCKRDDASHRSAPPNSLRRPGQPNQSAFEAECGAAALPPQQQAHDIGRRDHSGKNEFGASAEAVGGGGTTRGWRLLDIRGEGKYWSLPSEGTLTLGRSPECDIVISDTAVSGKHCTLVTSSGAAVELRELGGTNGTFVNDCRVARGTFHKLKDGDVIALASRSRLQFVLQSGGTADGEAAGQDDVPRPTAVVDGEPELTTEGNEERDHGCGAAQADSISCMRSFQLSYKLVDAATGEIWDLPKDAAIVFGRRPDCDITINEPFISGRHCTITSRVRGGSDAIECVELQDLGGANGTFVNGQKLDKATTVALRAQDVITLASQDGPKFTLQATPSSDTGENPDGTARNSNNSDCDVVGKPPSPLPENHSAGRQMPTSGMEENQSRKRAVATPGGESTRDEVFETDCVENVAQACKKQCSAEGEIDAAVSPSSGLRAKKRRTKADIPHECPDAQLCEEGVTAPQAKAVPDRKTCPSKDPILDEDEKQNSAIALRDEAASRGLQLSFKLVNEATAETWLLPRGGSLLIGRRSECDVVVDALSISGKHCAISSQAASGPEFGVRVELQDLGATNGTFVNGQKIANNSQVRLHAQDVIALAALDGPTFTLLNASLSDVGEAAESVASASPEKLLEQGSPEQDACVPEDGPLEQLGSPMVDHGQKRQSEVGVDELRQDAIQEAECEGTTVDDAIAESKKPCVGDANCSSAHPTARRRVRRKTNPAEIAMRRIAAPATAQAHDKQPAFAVSASVPEVAVAVTAAVQDRNAVQPRLVDLASGIVHSLPQNGISAIGRRGDCEVPVAGTMVSARHCVIICNGDTVEVEDVSANGSFVNDVRVPKGFSLPQRVPLRHGDRLSLGHADGPSFLFLAPAGEHGNGWRCDDEDHTTWQSAAGGA